MSNETRLRAGIVGGGRGAFIGSVHRMAAELDGQALIVAGAMSSDPERARQSARDWYLERSYESFESMAKEEAARPDGIDFAIIATPNHVHYAAARAFIEAGIAVVCDKPLALNVTQGEELAALVQRRHALFALTHNYTGYPLVHEARDLVRRGLLGELRKVLVEYQQDWLMTALESQGHKQASWRTDPERAGPAGCLGDIGTHAENLVSYISGLTIAELCADLTTFVPGRALEDDANVLLRFAGGAKGALICSQVACGQENNLNIRLFGTQGALEWHQQEPNSLIFTATGEPPRALRPAQSYLSDGARAASRLPPGHPEGYIEAFATLYRAFIADLRRKRRGEQPVGGYPDIAAGVRGLRFIAAALESARRGSQWVALAA